MAASTGWVVNNIVALASDPKIRGSISQVLMPYGKDDPIMYMVRWSGYSQEYQYLAEMLIGEEEANKQVLLPATEKPVEQSKTAEECHIDRGPRQC